MSQAVQRATEILDFLGEGPRSLSETAKRFNVHRSTVLRQLQTLEEAGFVLRRGNGHYSIGPKMISIAQQALDGLDLPSVAHDEIRNLHARTGNTVHLAQLVESTVMYVDKVEEQNSVRMYSRIGKTVLPHCTGVGKAILSQLSQARRDAVLANTEWTTFTPRTVASREALDEQLAVIKTRGWGVDDGEFEDFVNCIAVPITNSSASIVGAISLTAIKAVATLDDLMAHLEDVRRTAQTISRQLG
ncbi:helix-turn-helix domain-containing protein [Pseudarthrobacter psychrotolerans]|uniref:Helix-turn-helix domain-containing protein n=1 Tax=Pseudarthrobacter psychrotolerans TaxID=2697569 RepID=A0A6P1NP25_9MICC|nr:IclR family transcriptional regulator [Pseudarthrobacter psychrotolerans]QHK18541.1 helix-turn-helix domain-containing protein [Pseudarthrobacter psychrotolerans]